MSPLVEKNRHLRHPLASRQLHVTCSSPLSSARALNQQNWNAHVLRSVLACYGQFESSVAERSSVKVNSGQSSNLYKLLRCLAVAPLSYGHDWWQELSWATSRNLPVLFNKQLRETCETCNLVITWCTCGELDFPVMLYDWAFKNCPLLIRLTFDIFCKHIFLEVNPDASSHCRFQTNQWHCNLLLKKGFDISWTNNYQWPWCSVGDAPQEKAWEGGRKPAPSLAVTVQSWVGFHAFWYVQSV